MVTLLDDDMVHIAYHDELTAGQLFFSPMVATSDFGGPESYQYDESTQTLSSASVSVSIVDGCLRTVDLSGDEPLTLTQLCLLERGESLQVSMSQESFTQLYGLGQKLDSSNEYASWIGEERFPATRTGNAMTYSDIAASGDTQIPVGYVLGEGTDNYAFFVDTHYPLTFDFSEPQWTISSSDPSLGMFLFTGDNLKQLRSKYLELTGKPPVPPLKAFGLWVSEYGYDNWAELDSKLDTLKAADFPIDGFVLDLQWFGGINSGSENTQMGSLTWDRAAFPNPEQKMAELAGQNIGLVHIEESYVGAALPEFRQLAEKRQLAMDCEAPCIEASVLSSNPWWGIGGMIDWTSESARKDWHNDKRAPLIEDGFLGHWTDLGEPELYDYNSIYAGVTWYGEQQTSHRSVHNLLNFYWSQGIADHTAVSHPDRRPWILSRSGTAGSQRFGVAMWSGDVASRFLSLEAQMPAQTNMSLSGFDYYGSDIGGFHRNGLRGSRFDELYTRWFATAILMEVPLRPHTQNLCNCGETAPDRAGDSNSNLANLRTRYSLTPYLYSLAHQAYTAGEAMFPPLVYHFQEDATARNEDRTKMIGESLLYTAIIDDEDQVSSYLPVGQWVNYYDRNEVVQSNGAVYDRAVEVDGIVRAPLFLRAGAIVPTLANDVDNLGALQSGDIQWFDALNILAVADEQTHAFTLVEDDGLSRGYEQGQKAETKIETRVVANGYQLQVIPNSVAAASSATRQLTLTLVSPGATYSQVSVNGSLLSQIAPESSGAGWYLEAGAVVVNVGSVAVADQQTITFVR
ncbi:glycoside hydrolase family 31 protein [Corallincola platygyrae]